MNHALLDSRRSIETLRPYLCVLARMHLDRRLWSKLDPEDLVQATFQEALEHWDQFLGNGHLELKGWLRQMLLHNLWDAVRHFQQQKCDLGLEQPLNHSSSRLMLSLANQSTPSERAMKNEQLQALAEALLHLTSDQQEAVILHHLHAMKLTEVAAQLDRSVEATAGLVHRGLEKLKELLKE